ncbi:hypothetical protein [Mycobacteroides abscessus]
MSGYKAAALVSLIAGIAVIVSGFGCWVKLVGPGGLVTVEFNGNGNFTSRSTYVAQGVSAWDGWPVGWLTALLGAVIVGAAILHLMEFLEPEEAPKSIALPGFLVGLAAVAVMIDKKLPLDVPKGELTESTLSSGSALTYLLIAAAVAVVAGFAMSAMDE